MDNYLDEKYTEESGYVNIHGQDIRVFTCEKNGLILVPIDELKRSGFRIYHKCQYNKLLINDSLFTEEFNLFLLQAAQNYLFERKITFQENEILESINSIKRRLTEGSGSAQNDKSPSNKFLKNHVVEKSGEEDISITRTVRELTLTSPRKNPINRSFEQKNERSSEIQRGNHSFENKNQKTRRSLNDDGVPSRSFDQSSESSNDSRKYNNKNQKSSQNYGNSDQKKSSFDFNTTRNNNQSGEQIKQNGFQLRKPKTAIPNVQFNQQKGGDESPKEEKKIAMSELNKPEHNVIITFIEKPQCIWVQDIDNSQLLLEIATKVQEEVETQKMVTRCEYNNVYLAPEEGLWYRCKPIKFKPLIVFFIDYGNTAQMCESDLREASEELAAYPAQAMRVTYEGHYTPVLFDDIKIKIIKRFEKGTYKVDVVNKDTESAPVDPTTSPKNVKTTIATYFDKPKPLCTLENGQRVMIINEIGGRFALRTKECYDKLRVIEQEIEGVTVETVENVQMKQLVLCKKDNKFVRGQVTKTEGIEIDLLDYCEKIKADTSDIKYITEALSLKPITYILSPQIRGCKEFTIKDREFVKKLVETKAKATVVLEDGKFDLNLGKGLLSEQIGITDRIMFKDFKISELSLGTGSYMIYGFRDSDSLTLVSGEDLETYMADIIQTDVEDNKPYTPIVGEVCFGLYQGSWSRCVILKVLTSRFEVQFVDFGNYEFLNTEQLRKLDKKLKQVPIIGVPCRLVGLPTRPNIESLLEKEIEETFYNCVVKKFDSGAQCYEIEVPELYAKLRE